MKVVDVAEAEKRIRAMFKRKDAIPTAAAIFLAVARRGEMKSTDIMHEFHYSGRRPNKSGGHNGALPMLNKLVEAGVLEDATREKQLYWDQDQQKVRRTDLDHARRVFKVHHELLVEEKR